MRHENIDPIHPEAGNAAQSKYVRDLRSKSWTKAEPSCETRFKMARLSKTVRPRWLLRTKLSVVSALLLLVLSQTFSIWNLYETQMRMIGVVLGDEQTNLSSDMSSFSKQISKLGIMDDRWISAAARTIFQSSYSNNAVLYYDGEVLANSTSYEFDLEAGTPLGEKYQKYVLISAYSSNDSVAYLAGINGSILLITYIEESSYGSGNGFALLHYRDVTVIFRESRLLFLHGIIISLALALILGLTLTLIIRRLFVPLYQLKNAANVIADGQYEERVPLKRRTGKKEDEVTEIALAFNRMAENVDEHIRTLDEMNERQRMLLGALSHELRTPMTSIQGYAELLQRVSLSPERQASALNYIEQESRRLSRLSVKMLQLLELVPIRVTNRGRVSLYLSDESKIESKEISVAALFSKAKDIVQKRLKEKEISLQFMIQEELNQNDAEQLEQSECQPLQKNSDLTITGDEDLLLSLLTNLIDNARKASPQGSMITLFASTEGLFVQDEGCGIAPEEQKKILEPFYMVDKARTRQEGGAGLGLALCAQIARLHGGRIVIESTPGKGSRIGVRWNVFQTK
ncbi:MAG: HAMP domain-containing histidine kinase [Lachnospiraceae bacterium]|nr:HAMP domain-containing histidine kinase [Lachnospiraceae bacterium]